MNILHDIIYCVYKVSDKQKKPHRKFMKYFLQISFKTLLSYRKCHFYFPFQSDYEGSIFPP